MLFLRFAIDVHVGYGVCLWCSASVDARVSDVDARVSGREGGGRIGERLTSLGMYGV